MSSAADITENPMTGWAGTRARLVPLAALSAAAWDRLLPASAAPMMRRDWALQAAGLFATDRPAQALIVGSPAAPEALLPLYRPGGTPGTLRHLGALDLGETADIPARNPAALDALAAGLWRLGCPVDLGHALTDTALLPALRRHKPLAGLLLRQDKPMHALPCIALDPGWTDPGQAIGSKFRQTLRRKRRIATRDFGPVETRILSPSPDEAATLIDRAYAVEAQGWKSRNGTALIQDRLQAAFFHRLGRSAAAEGRLRLAFLEIGGVPAAMQLGLETGGAFWSLRIGYDERFARVSPGDLLMFDLIGHALRVGLERIELCGKAAEWTRRWGAEGRPIAALRLFPPGLAGLRGLCGEAGGLARRRWRGRGRR